MRAWHSLKGMAWPVVKWNREDETTVSVCREIITHRAVHILQPSMTKVSSLLDGKQICALAQPDDVSVALHAVYFGPGLARPDGAEGERRFWTL
jgi:hypothetical protein